ncbi:MAG: hypothetical protein A2860_01105 [Candidatus Levybacteria bacterium RIFCSPHIGHO2_01_FULL_37_33]|nr:MAG: hypothetical protein A3J17_01360 [Candidatus Curtissbacteria bacterium RIFCSPLOWO2_02_FULL_40_11]OGH14679.1 MAG: hypothetical protein A2860_01105 [Candidatus Levybacteria bacterium RIFCSPHIGHO2_01_FULL_37_33]
MADANGKNVMTQLENMLDEYFGKKAPALPQNIKEIIVKIAPYLVIISLIFTIPAILALFGLGSLATILAPLGGARSVAGVPTMWIGILLLIPAVILEAMAVPGLFSRKIVAWRYMFWAQLISIISSLVQINIVGALLSALIGFYLLFQVKSLYK